MDQWLRQHGATAGVQLSEVRILAEFAFSLSRTALVTSKPEQFTTDQLSNFSALLARRSSGEPIAYITGQREFYSRRFEITKDVLIPRHDTETLIEAILNLPLPTSARVIDLGTGSGCIAITLALERPNWRVTATDISSAALALAQRNANELGAKLHFTVSHWWQSVAVEPFDIIISNPPYIAAGDAHLSQGDLPFEPLMALSDGADGLSAYRQILQGSALYSKATSNSFIAFEHGFDQAGAISALLAAKGCQAITLCSDLSGQPRVTTAQLPLALK